jgi:hypothetical protein
VDSSTMPQRCAEEAAHSLDHARLERLAHLLPSSVNHKDGTTWERSNSLMGKVSREEDIYDRTSITTP